jgi:hypothetical protein
VAGQAPVDAAIERYGRGIKISPDHGAPYAAEACIIRTCSVIWMNARSHSMSARAGRVRALRACAPRHRNQRLTFNEVAGHV